MVFEYVLCNFIVFIILNVQGILEEQICVYLHAIKTAAATGCSLKPYISIFIHYFEIKTFANAVAHVAIDCNLTQILVI